MATISKTEPAGRNFKGPSVTVVNLTHACLELQMRARQSIEQPGQRFGLECKGAQLWSP
jgi:hypothetical protein